MTVRRPATAFALCAAVAVLASTASATESTIYPGVGIGKVKLGMTLAQVEHVLGRDLLLDTRTDVSGTPYIEYGWNFSTFSVGFLRRGSTYQAAQVEVAVRGERTPTGIGVGSSFKSVARAYPQAICRGYYTSMGSSTDASVFDANHRSFTAALVVAKDRKHLAFLVKPARPNDYEGLYVVWGVIVRASIPGAVDFVPKLPCRDGWRARGTP